MAIPVASCERCESALERGDLRCPVCGLAAPVSSATRTAIKVRILRCEGCGAALSYDPKVQAPRCGYCGSVMHVESVEDPMEQADSFLPFTIGAPTARLALKRWLSGLGRFRPSDLTSATRLESLRPLWWVAWVFDAKSLISWTADSDYGRGRADWAPHAGQAEMEFDDIVVSASRGLSEEETDALASHHDLSTARPDLEGPEGAAVEQFDVQRSMARRRVLEEIDRRAVEWVEKRVVPGTRCRNVHAVSLLRGLVTRRFAFPAYVMAYRYKNRVYRAIASGQDASFVYGSAPYSVAKIVGAVVATAAVVMATVWLLASFG